ncbi:GTP-binding protein [Taphrina deformans PYCC 5710]|uniref:GTP-binding protein n=1 Tax=Taphrina deformans (strain PYCC 5710 / ATCC 11124 / CBS 356.35 / IMI 108563 / JCM 9778 / NBRC 8474) TaxID=1097556 RepID=R4XBU5_TAPDE|nr:GTP-binding protein [Taphrina deformans PYCC 5710]|eukprot:CCG80815.1 GTP-binding protein [Taphrina deformans PYCC 5710]
MGILERIADIEKEMARTQKNKATEYHVGLLRGKLARLRSQLLEPPKASAKGEGFDVTKTGDARVVFIGFPSVGKSSLLSKITKTESHAASYEFTTLTAIPGVLPYDGAEIQALDLPGIIQGASSGKGRGRQVVAVAKTADLILMVLDAKSDNQKTALEAELEAVGIRLNRQRPDVTFKVKQGGGISYNSTVKQTKGFDEKMVSRDWRMHNADVLVREDITTDDFIDVVLGNRKYINCLYVYNKIDAVSLETVDELARRPNSLVISCKLDLNLDYLKDRIWQELNLLRIYTKRKGEIPNFDEALIVRSGSTVEKACDSIHRTLSEQFRYGLVWGLSAKHRPQRVGLSHLLGEGDVLSIITK